MNDFLSARVMTRQSAPCRAWPSTTSLLLCVGALLAACGADDEIAGEPAGGSGSGGWSPPPLRDTLALSDGDVARQALAVLGSATVGAEGSCSNCHSLGRPTLTRWLSLTRTFVADCLADPSLPDSASVDDMIDCFSARAQSASTFVPGDFGIYSAAAHLPWFRFVFDHQGGAPSETRASHDQFVANVGMPRSGSLLTQAQFDLVAEWFARDLPQLFDLVPEDDGEDCTDGLDPRLRAHVEEMAQSGWRARNEQVPLLMFGCGEGEAGIDCLTDFPLASEEALAWDAPSDARIRVLYDNSATPTRFWSRASPDGRYIASGLIDRGRSELTGQFLDLARNRVIDAAFSYDPTFFPDNSGFLVQRDGGYSSASPSGATNGAADRGDVAVLCDQSVLADNPSQITGDEAQCIALDSQIGLYQQLAKSIDGEDYWVVYGAYDSDDGGGAPVLENPSAAFGSDSVTTLVPMVNEGARFEPGAATRISTPNEGDPMLSPSGRLMVTRLKGREYSRQLNGVNLVTAEQSGYALQLVDTSRNGNRWSASLSDVGRICMQGGKAVISYDERWMVFHHYVTDGDARALGYAGANDPDFADYRALGASNLYLVDLMSGDVQPITDMGAGQYALFPHFRSDGWIYFVVRSLDGEEYFAASDAAVLLEQSGGG